jgi:hypothetical protein
MPAMGVPILTYSGVPLVPLYGKKAIEQAVNLAPNGVFPRGTLLGPINSSANDVQTITIGGAPTGGTFTITGTSPTTGAAVTLNPAFNISTAALQALLVAIYGTGNVVVTGTAGTTYILTAAGQLVNTPVPPLGVSPAGLTGGTPTATIAHTTYGRTAGTYAAYASGNADGSQVPKCILRHDCATDGGGNIALGGAAASPEYGITRPETPAYFSGYFRASDLVGLDANALGLAPPRFVLINGVLGQPNAQVELL